MSEYEKQVIKLTKFKPNEFDDHQDYLASLVRHADKWLQKHDLSGDIFGAWDDALCNWFDEAVHAMNNGSNHIPDFPDREIAEPGPEFEDEEEGGDGGHTGAPEVAETIPNEESSSPPPVLPGTPEPLPAPSPEPEPAAALIPAKRKKWEVKGPTRIPTPYDILTGDRDRYGVIVGTKTHDAIQMYERGTSAKELLQALGGRHYNIMNRLKRDGHKVVKLPKHRFKIYHKDDVEREKQAKAAADMAAPIVESGHDEDE